MRLCSLLSYLLLGVGQRTALAAESSTTSLTHAKLIDKHELETDSRAAARAPAGPATTTITTATTNTNTRVGHESYEIASRGLSNEPKLNLQNGQQGIRARPSDVAYVAVLLGDNDIGVRTLGQSLLDSGTTVDMVAVLAPEVGAETQSRLRRQGWIVHRVRMDEHLMGFGIDLGTIDDAILEVRDL